MRGGLHTIHESGFPGFALSFADKLFRIRKLLLPGTQPGVTHAGPSFRATIPGTGYAVSFESSPA
jgi:hypothetical protein